ncbi:MAG: pilus assembly protein [Pseudorhodobacter sp.]|nr:TadE/TadG family type IV pilus assembly protein [Pseudorhodobacter sp.]MDN5788766.1 pilus assembly protein [Pseudorhodobacter sp.]
MARFWFRLTGFSRAEAGTASVEFVLLVPVLMLLFMASIESGVLMTRTVMLERGVDQVMRQLRLGQIPNPTVDLLETAICSRSVILKDCKANIHIELQPVSMSSWQFPSTATDCIDRDEPMQPATTFNPGASQQVMLVRVCVIQDAFFPGTGVGLRLARDSQGGYGIIAATAFVNEP